MRIRAHAVRHKGGRPEPFSYERELGPRDVLVMPFSEIDEAVARVRRRDVPVALLLAEPA